MVRFAGCRSITLVLVLAVGGLCGCGSSGDAPSASPANATQPVPDTPAAAQPAQPGDAREDWPTEEEAKAAILKLEQSIHASETNKSVWHVKDLRHEVKSVKFAERTTQKQMNFGVSAITVYPAKILYTRITEYTDKPETREEEGADGVWFFYRDSFGDWTCKYGSE